MIAYQQALGDSGEEELMFNIEMGRNQSTAVLDKKKCFPPGTDMSHSLLFVKIMILWTGSKTKDDPNEKTKTGREKRSP